MAGHGNPSFVRLPQPSRATHLPMFLSVVPMLVENQKNQSYVQDLCIWRCTVHKNHFPLISCQEYRVLCSLLSGFCGFVSCCSESWTRPSFREGAFSIVSGKMGHAGNVAMDRPRTITLQPCMLFRSSYNIIIAFLARSGPTVNVGGSRRGGPDSKWRGMSHLCTSCMLPSNTLMYMYQVYTKYTCTLNPCFFEEETLNILSFLLFCYVTECV